MLVGHTEVTKPIPRPETAYKVLQVEPIRYISHPYEWSFSQYKDAALLTLQLQKEALKLGMTLKDASAYNVQFQDGHPVFIDTLSFSRYLEGTPWVAYRQFCQHFLAPLALMALVDVRLGKLMTTYIDGIPLDLASKLLPFSTRFNYGLVTHVHLHSLFQSHYTSTRTQRSGVTVSKIGLIGLIENLENTINKLSWRPKGTDWVSYYNSTNYSDASFTVKKQIVEGLINQVKPNSMYDLGANTGVFSRLANRLEGCQVISMDMDPGAVEINYIEVKRTGETNILPLVLDLTNPSPDIGWHNRERSSFLSRGPADLVMALALIHHLAISYNIPLSMISDTLATLGRYLIIEFVPKEDSQVQRLLASREDIFSDYSLPGFRDAFLANFNLIEEIVIKDTMRTIFLLERK